MRTNCASCGVEIQVHPYAIKHSKLGVCCGRKCHFDLRRVPLEERFWKHINKDGPVPSHRPELGPCWLWTASLDSRGYGAIGKGDGSGNGLRSHRVSWEIHFGPIPTGKWVLHACDERKCQRPSHLFLGDRQANIDDMMAKKRNAQPKAEDHGMAKLDWVKVRKIRKLYAFGGGNTLKELSAVFGVTSTMIRYIVTNQNWKE